MAGIFNVTLGNTKSNKGGIVLSNNNWNQLKPQTGHWLDEYPDMGPSYRGRIAPQGTNLIDRVDLHYMDSSSDKVYICLLSQEGSTFYVQGYYGRRGNYSLSEQEKYRGTSEADARAQFAKLVASKQKKQYQAIGQASRKAETVSNKDRFEDRVVWPMNAQPLKEGKKKDSIIESDEWIAEEKEDGVRLTVHVTPTGLRMFSRSAGKDDPSRPLEKTQAFAHVKDIVFPEKYVGTIFDTEAMAIGMDSATISGHINATDGRDNSFLYFKVFDLLQEGAVDITSLEWKYRRMKLTQMINELALVGLLDENGKSLFTDTPLESGLFQLTKYTIRNKVEFHDDIILRNGEGTMWKNINAPYKEGARPANNWYKWKKQDTADVVIVGFTAGQGKYAGQIGAVRYAEFLTDEEITAYGIKKPHTEYMYTSKDYYLVEIGQCSGMTDEQRLDFTNNQGTYLGQVMEVEFMERTSKGALRHPRYIQMRKDKKSTDCVHENQK